MIDFSKNDIYINIIFTTIMDKVKKSDVYCS